MTPRPDYPTAASPQAGLETTKPNSQHTPGPWRVDADGYEITAKGWTIVETSLPVYEEPRNRAELRDEQIANARLIAAAPEMLAALQAITARVNGVWDDPALLSFGDLSENTIKDTMRIARTAIAKVTGGQP